MEPDVKVSRQPWLLVLLLLLPATLASGFAWGFFCHRARILPFSSLRHLAIEAGLLQGSRGISLQAVPAEPGFKLANPYLSGTLDTHAERRGVEHLDRRRASPGQTLVTTKIDGRSIAMLIDLDGQPLWSWSLGAVERLHLVELLPDGGLLAIDQGRALLRLDREARTIWRVEGAFHHVVAQSGDKITTLRSRRRVVPAIHESASVLDEEIVVLDEEGREIEAVSILDALLASPFAFLLPAPTDDEIAAAAFGHPLADAEIDLLHANHLEPTGSTTSGPEALRDPDGWLVSLRNLHLLVVVDRHMQRATWAWGPGRLTLQHHPTIQPSGTILLFNNGRFRSEALEIDPSTHRVLWRYGRDGFFSAFGGGCQRLPNGNTLITESASGYVFEVTPEGRTVWSWANPDVSAEGIRGTIYRAWRYRLEELPFLSSGRGMGEAPAPRVIGNPV